MSWFSSLIGGGLEGIMKGADEIVETFVGDEAEKQKMKHQLRTMIESQKHQMEMQAGEIVEAEAKSEHFLTANWRPITMLTFVVIIANNYIIAPYTEAMFGVNVRLDIPPDMWDLLKLGLGGYVAGRSGEKMIREYKKKSSS